MSQAQNDNDARDKDKGPIEVAIPPLEKLPPIDPSKLNLRDELILLNRCAKVVKGGRRFSFSALVVVGDGEGHVGIGFGKANEVPEAISKAVESGKKNLQRVPLMGRTIPHQVYGISTTAKVLLKPASQGTGLIASAQVRKVLQLAGVQDILAKSLGSKNNMNIAKATLNGLVSLKRPEQVARLRGKKVEELIGRKNAAILRQSRIHRGEDLTAEDKAAEAALQAAQAAKAATLQDEPTDGAES